LPATSNDKARGKNFMNAEIDRMLETAEKQLPRGQHDWEEVARLFNHGQRAEVHRKWDTLRKKFNRICITKNPTGEYGYERAIAIQKKIEERCQIFEGNDKPVESELSEENMSLLLDIIEEQLPQTEGDWDQLQSNLTITVILKV
jgi:hypothetical protein